MAPAVLVAVPLSDSVRRLVYLCALALVWSLIVNAVLHERAPRRWTGIAIGTGLMVLGEAAHVLFVVSGLKAGTTLIVSPIGLRPGKNCRTNFSETTVTSGVPARSLVSMPRPAMSRGRITVK